MRIILAITGASGIQYGIRLCEELLAAGQSLTLLISPAGFAVLKAEAGFDWNGTEVEVSARLQKHFQVPESRLSYYAGDNLLAPVASGSSAADAMVVCPCSMGSLARIACGNSGNLLERSADVMLKEKRPLVLVPRETPLSEIHLENMLKLARMGTRIVPAMPAMYHAPQTVAQMIDFMVGKVLEALGIEHDLYRPWNPTVKR
ncbi:MAG: UbiX family flavin prenyltransferase [Deltaproteobacteria bacterium]|nr:UbiX family flavin prenyltransferase [Deltaproteobacteria bacterium]